MSAPMIEPVATVQALRVPPQAAEAEQSLLGGLLLTNAAWDRIAEIVSERDFYRPEHRLIFRAIARLIQNGKPADALTVADFLRDHERLDSAGGQAYIGSLAINTPSAANIRRYAELIRNKAILRDLADRANALIERCLAPGDASPQEIAQEAESAFAAVLDRHAGDIVPLADAIGRALEEIDARQTRGDGMAGVSTGFGKLDEMTGGFSPGELILIAARPSMGKTALAMNLSYHVAERHGPVVVFSLEMSEQQLAMRLLSDASAVPMIELRAGRLGDRDWQQLSEAAPVLSELPVFLDDTPAVTCAHIRTRARRIKRQHGLAMIVVDYLQLASGGGDNRSQEVGSVSRGLKAIAKELKVPVIALSQLNRGVEQRPDKRPMMSDLRDSGELEQDADLIAFIYRDEVYNPQSPAKGTAELLIRKQRNGPLGDIRLLFREERMAFENYAGPTIVSGGNPGVRKSGGEHRAPTV